VGLRVGLDGCVKSRPPPTGIRSTYGPARSESQEGKVTFFSLGSTKLTKNKNHNLNPCSRHRVTSTFQTLVPRPVAISPAHFPHRMSNYTHQQMNMYILFKNSKIYIKTLKTLLNVSILRSSSGSIHCSLLNLQFKNTQ